MTSQADLSRWFDEGVARGATHMIVVCDTYDWTDYPVYVSGGDPQIVFNANNGPNMTKAMECYALWKPKDAQIKTLGRIRDFDLPGPPIPTTNSQERANPSSSLAEPLQGAHAPPCTYCKGRGYVPGDPEGAPVEDCPKCSAPPTPPTTTTTGE